ncbi:TolC family protein [Nannocystis radixulma]|uniref:TolC family protein n=1 Tax=Nannocystis radixulma TaxID=2995305 RepID=A0ABT5B0T4_9BACT|nr:TolC family protein [Nannocystis radixulma]MDC0667073.1 TolC family protein [Nannocystis radixulma]
MIAWALALLLAGPPAIDGSPRAAASVAEPGFSLDQALAAMREGHPLRDFAAARADSAAATRVAARLWDNPVVNVDYFLGVRSTSYDRAGALVAGVAQWLPVTAVPRARGQVASHEERAVARDNQGLLRALELEVERAVLGLAGALRAAEIHHDALADLQESERIVGARVAGGVAPKYDATRIGLAVAAAEAAFRGAEADVSEARGQLDVAVGPLAERLHGPPRVDVFAGAEVPPLATLQARMLEGRPDLAAAGERFEAARASVRVARREVFPGIGLRVAAGFGQGPGQVDVGAGLTVPLPILSRGQGFIDRARAEARAADSVARALVVAAEQRLHAAHEVARQRNDASLRHVAMSRDAAEALLHQAQANYQNGRLSAFELADASLSVREMHLRDLELALAARLAELEVRRVVEVGGPE